MGRNGIFVLALLPSFSVSEVVGEGGMEGNCAGMVVGKDGISGIATDLGVECNCGQGVSLKAYETKIIHR